MMVLTGKMYALGRMQRKPSNGIHEALESGFPLGVAVCVCVCVCVKERERRGQGAEKEVPKLRLNPCFQGCFEAHRPKAHVTCDITLTSEPKPLALSQRLTVPGQCLNTRATLAKVPLKCSSSRIQMC